MSSGYAPFDTYREEFKGLVRSMEEQLQQQQQSPPPPTTSAEGTPERAAVDKAKEETSNDRGQFGATLVQSQELLLRMKVAAREAPGASLKRELKDVYEACKLQLESYKMLHQKTELFASDSTSWTIDDSAGTTYLFGEAPTHDTRVTIQNARLEGALRSLRETEEIAWGITDELDRNRTTLKKSKRRVGELSGMMEQANGHMKSLLRKWW